MASADKELEQQLRETGNKLLRHPSSVDELLPLLDQVENFLSRVEQSPPKSMQAALSPSMKALVEDELIKHSDVDVKVAVASCISEITRITAPDAPYDDDKMKDVFQLIVSSFENLSDKSSRSYNKRASILETVAKVRSCVVMLDLECDGLIVEMFQHFLEAVRDYHPDNVVTSMETIMTLVLEESEDISLELLTPILASAKRDNEEFPPIARKLGERVFENCAVKLKPYLTQAVKSLGVSVDDYSKVVASICEGTSGAVEHNDDNAFGEKLNDDESKLAKASPDEAAQADENKLPATYSEETAQVAKESVTEEPCPEEVKLAVDRSPKSVMSNGITETVNEGTSVDLESLKKSEDGHPANESLNVNLTSKDDTDDSDAGKSVKLESKPEQNTTRSGRKPSSLSNSTEPSDSSLAHGEKESEKLPDHQKSGSKDVCTSPGEDPSVEAAAPSESEKETGIQPSSPKALVSEAVNVASPSQSESLPDESLRKKAVQLNKKESLAQEDPPFGDVCMKAAEGTSDSDVKPQRRSKKKAPAGITREDKIPASAGTSKNEGGTNSDLEAKPLRQSGKKETEKQPDRQKSRRKDGRTSHGGDPSVEVAAPSESEKVTGIQLSSPKALESEAVNDASPSQSGSLPDESLLKKAVRPKKKESSTQEDPLSGDICMKASEGTSDSDVKPQRRSRKKAPAGITKEDNNPAGGGTSKNRGVTNSDSEAKPLRQSGKKVDASDSEAKLLKQSGKKGNSSNNIDDKSALKTEDNRKRRGRGKDIIEKDLTKSSAKDDVKDMVSSPKSTTKSVKDEGQLEETPKINSKRKRTAGKGKASETVEYGEKLVGSKVKVWWPQDKMFYEGVIGSFDPVKMRHKVLYTDGDEEILNLRKETWELVEGDCALDEEHAAEDSSPDASSKMHKKKKAKINSEPLANQEKIGGAASSSKLKGSATKAGRKSKDEGKVGSKSKDNTSKSIDKYEDATAGKSKRSGGDKSVAGKSKDVDGGTPKTTTKPKQDTLNTVNKSKGKTSRMSQAKSSSSKVKETENANAKSPDTEKSPETVKGKSRDTSKARESGAKSGKKRRKRS